MRELTSLECQKICGSDYSGWQVIAISGISTGVPFAMHELFLSGSVTTASKFFLACSVPGAFTAALIVAGVHLYQHFS